MMTKILKIFSVLVLINSCSYPEMIRNEVVYFNNFDDNTKIDSNIDGYSTIMYNQNMA